MPGGRFARKDRRDNNSKRRAATAVAAGQLPLSSSIKVIAHCWSSSVMWTNLAGGNPQGCSLRRAAVIRGLMTTEERGSFEPFLRQKRGCPPRDHRLVLHAVVLDYANGRAGRCYKGQSVRLYDDGCYDDGCGALLENAQALMSAH